MEVGDVQWLTGLRGDELVAVAWGGKVAERQRKDDADARKAEGESQKQVCWMAFINGEVMFLGNIVSKKVDELKDIC